MSTMRACRWTAVSQNDTRVQSCKPFVPRIPVAADDALINTGQLSLNYLGCTGRVEYVVHHRTGVKHPQIFLFDDRHINCGERCRTTIARGRTGIPWARCCVHGSDGNGKMELCSVIFFRVCCGLRVYRIFTTRVGTSNVMPRGRLVALQLMRSASVSRPNSSMLKGAPSVAFSCVAPK